MEIPEKFNRGLNKTALVSFRWDPGRMFSLYCLCLAIWSIDADAKRESRALYWLRGQSAKVPKRKMLFRLFGQPFMINRKDLGTRHAIKQCAAFVFFPNDHESARLETMPFALNAVRMLAQAGWQVDLYLWELHRDTYKDRFGRRVEVFGPSRLKQMCIRLINRFPSLCNFWVFLIQLEARLLRRYDIVFGVGQRGAVFASKISQGASCPFVYFNDEFPGHWGEGTWTALERASVATADVYVVPDGCRVSALEVDCPSLEGKEFAVLPNVSECVNKRLDIDWRSRLGLPRDAIPLLHAGSIADWAQVPELLCTVPLWPSNTVLILQSRAQLPPDAKGRLSHLLLPGRVFFSETPLQEDELNSLVGFCAGSFALYRNSGANIETIGWASGKLTRSLLCGTPVIASNFSSLQFVKDENVGVLVDHPLEIPDAVSTISGAQEDFRSRCLAYSQENLIYSQHWRAFVSQVRSVTGVDLGVTS